MGDRSLSEALEVIGWIHIFWEMIEWEFVRRNFNRILDESHDPMSESNFRMSKGANEAEERL